MRSPLLLTILTALGCPGGADSVDGIEGRMCLDVADDATSCPAAADVDPADLSDESYCDYAATEVTGEGTLGEWGGGMPGDKNCCYPVLYYDEDPNSECAIGRPYMEAGEARVAACTELPDAPAAAQAWLRVARMEHASIASFARLSLELMALGAPLELLSAVQQAAFDEVEHAKMAFALASRFAGQPVSPGRFPFAAPIQPTGDLTALAASTVREGCLGETIGAWLTEKAAAVATDPEVRATLSRIAADEARHAALSWKIVAWALSVGGAPVRAAVQQAFAAPFPVAGIGGAGLEDCGVLSPAAQATAIDEGVAAVVAPAMQALLM